MSLNLAIFFIWQKPTDRKPHNRQMDNPDQRTIIELTSWPIQRILGLCGSVRGSASGPVRSCLEPHSGLNMAGDKNSLSLAAQMLAIL